MGFHNVLLSLLTIISVENVYAKVEATIGPLPLKDNFNLAMPIPQMNDSEIIISREEYVISYNKIRRAPNWVAWKLEAKDIGSVRRANAFSKDPDLDKYLIESGDRRSTVDGEEYSGSCFDRGHQVPSKDRTDNVHVNEETFLTSNVIPQTPYLNRVIWEHLEQRTRDMVQKEEKQVYVIAGPVYDEDFGAIGPKNDIAVPSKNFKIILSLNRNQNPRDILKNSEKIAVLMPNVHQDGSKPIGRKRCARENFDAFGNANDWEEYKTTVSQIEKATGVRFSFE